MYTLCDTCTLLFENLLITRFGTAAIFRPREPTPRRRAGWTEMSPGASGGCWVLVKWSKRQRSREQRSKCPKCYCAEMTTVELAEIPLCLEPNTPHSLRSWGVFGFLAQTTLYYTLVSIVCACFYPTPMSVVLPVQPAGVCLFRRACYSVLMARFGKAAIIRPGPPHPDDAPPRRARISSAPVARQRGLYDVGGCA